MSDKPSLGGVIHTYQKYDPARFPPPAADGQADAVSAAFDHLLEFGDMEGFTEEDLENAVRLDPSQIAGLGPGIDSLIAMLERRKRKILETHEAQTVRKKSARAVKDAAAEANPPKKLADAFHKAVRDAQIHDLERLWYRAEREDADFAERMMSVLKALEDRYQIDELAGKYEFTGHEPMSVEKALEVKEELEAIDKLLEQLREARKNAKLAVIDFDQLSRFAPEEDVQNLSEMQKRIQQMIRELAERQGLERSADGQGYQLTPKAFTTFQSKLLEEIFSNLEAGRTGRHEGPILGEGAVELSATRPYEFGDPVSQMDIPATFVNAMIRAGAAGGPIRLDSRDIEIHKTRNRPKAATVVLLDMSGSMRYGGQYVNVKRMGLALSGLIRREFPGDWLQFIEMYSFARAVPLPDVPKLLPKPVTIHNPVVRLRADMSNPDVDESDVPPHFTNIQHGLSLARRFLAAQDTPNRQVFLITDGLPTAHFEQQLLFLLYPPDPRTEQATMREGLLAAREGITINIFLLSSWNQTREDIRFAYRLAESTKGRVFFTAGRNLERFVVWDYLNRRRKIIG